MDPSFPHTDLLIPQMFRSRFKRPFQFGETANESKRVVRFVTLKNPDLHT